MYVYHDTIPTYWSTPGAPSASRDDKIMNETRESTVWCCDAIIAHSTRTTVAELHPIGYWSRLTTFESSFHMLLYLLSGIGTVENNLCFQLEYYITCKNM